MSSEDVATLGRTAPFCGECGNKLALGLKFCGGCGIQLGSAPVASAEAARPMSPGAVDSDPTQTSGPGLTLLQGWGYYGAGCASLSVLLLFKSFDVGVFGYLAIGVFMSRFVMRRLVEWHPQYNTLHNVVSAKIWMVLLWPWRMLLLLIQLSANRVL